MSQADELTVCLHVGSRFEASLSIVSIARPGRAVVRVRMGPTEVSCWLVARSACASPRDPLACDVAVVELRVLKVLERISGDCHGSVFRSIAPTGVAQPFGFRGIEQDAVPKGWTLCVPADGVNRTFRTSDRTHRIARTDFSALLCDSWPLRSER